MRERGGEGVFSSSPSPRRRGLRGRRGRERGSGSSSSTLVSVPSSSIHHHTIIIPHHHSSSSLASPLIDLIPLEIKLRKKDPRLPISGMNQRFFFFYLSSFSSCFFAHQESNPCVCLFVVHSDFDLFLAGGGGVGFFLGRFLIRPFGFCRSVPNPLCGS